MTKSPTIPNSVTDALRAAMADATFKTDTMRQFNELVDRVESLESMNDYLRRQAKDAEDELSDVKADLTKANSDLAKWYDKETDLEARERQIFNLEAKSAVMTAKADTLRDCFNTVFKNSIMRTEVQRRASGAMNSLPDEETVTKTEE